MNAQGQPEASYTPATRMEELIQGGSRPDVSDLEIPESIWEHENYYFF